MALYPDSSMGPPMGGMPQGTPPIIPGLTQLSPERMDAVLQSQRNPPMEQGEGMEEERSQLPRLIAAQFSLIQQAAELGPAALEQLSTVAMAALKQFKKELGPPPGQGMMAAPPVYGVPPPELAGPSVPMSPGVPGEMQNAPFLSLLAAGGR